MTRAEMHAALVTGYSLALWDEHVRRGLSLFPGEDAAEVRARYRREAERKISESERAGALATIEVAA